MQPAVRGGVELATVYGRYDDPARDGTERAAATAQAGLVVVDEYTRECLAIGVERRLG